MTVLPLADMVSDFPGFPIGDLFEQFQKKISLGDALMLTIAKKHLSFISTLVTQKIRRAIEENGCLQLSRNIDNPRHGSQLTVFSINHAADIGGSLGSVGADSSAVLKTYQMRLKPHLQGDPAKKGGHSTYICLLLFQP